MSERKLKQGWFAAYEEYSQQSESPEAYHLWTALTVLSAAVRRHVFVSQGHFTIYPNLFVLLVSPPGVCRKSVAMGIGLRLLRQVGGIPIEANKVTPQSLIHSMSGGAFVVQGKKKKKTPLVVPTQADVDALKAAMAAGAAPSDPDSVSISTESSTLLASTEFSVMLGPDAHQNGMLSLLTDLYDCPDVWEYKTLKRGVERLGNVFLAILGATTPEWLGASIPQDAIGGGFTSRILFVVQSQRRHDNPFPKLTKRELELRDLLVSDLKHISQLQGEVFLDADAEKWYDTWYRNREQQAMDERFWGYLERKPAHLLKIATLLKVSFDDELIIRTAHLKMALQLLDNLEVRMPDAFRGIGGGSSKDIEKIIEYLARAQGILTYREIAHKTYRHLSKPELRIVLETMIDAGMIVEDNNGSQRFIKLSLPAMAAAKVKA